MDTKGFTITTNTTEEVTVNTTKDDTIAALNDRIDALFDIVKEIAETKMSRSTTAQTDTDDSDTSGHEDEPETEAATPTVADLAKVLSATQDEADEHGFMAATVEVERPDAPPEPEPVVVDTTQVDTDRVDTEDYPKINDAGVRPSEDDSIYQPGRWGAGSGNNAIGRAIGSYTKWAVAQGMGVSGLTITDRHPFNSLLDWIAFTAGRRMTKAQARTALLRMEDSGHVRRVGKRGKQDLWIIDPNGGYTRYLA